MLRDVRSNVTDGLLGFATATGDGLHIKIGVSPSVTEKPITILGSMGASTIKSKLGLSPLADAVMDAVQGGAARVFCIPVAASTAGTIGEVTKTGDGGGSVTVQGSPNNAYALTVRFTAQGGLNTAAFVYDGLERYGHPAQQRVAAHTGHRRRRAALLGAGVSVSEHRP